MRDHRVLELFFLFCLSMEICLIFFTKTDAAITAPEKMVNFTKKYFTIFPTDEQLWKENDVIGYGFYALQSQSQIGQNMSDTFVSSLVGTAGLVAMQKLQCLTVELGGPTALQTMLDHVTDVISNASKPLYNQIIKKVTSMKVDSRGPNAQYSQIFRMCAQWWTQQSVCVIMRWANNYMPAKETAALKKCLNDVVWFQNCGF